MTFQDSLETLARWLDESLGAPIVLPSGQKKGLRLTQDYTLDEIEEFEDEWDVEFPEPYRQFLLQVGACEVFYGGTGLGRGISFSRLDAIPELYHEYFDRKDSLLFSQFLPIGGVYGQQQVAAFDLTRKVPENFALFSDEQQATEWAASAESTHWLRFEDWVAGLVEREGEP
jgi:hypothetical protein